MWYRVGMKRKPPVTNDRQHHVRISHRSYERLIECLRSSTIKSRRQLLDNLIHKCSKDMGVEKMLMERWNKGANRKKTSRARRAGR